MSYLSFALAALASVVIGGFIVGMGLGFLLGRRFDDAGPGDPPLLERDE
jgi:F0F1-type ATP synthase assembly protein I